MAAAQAAKTAAEMGLAVLWPFVLYVLRQADW